MKVLLFVGLLCAVTYETASKIIQQECTYPPDGWKPNTWNCDMDCTKPSKAPTIQCIWERNFTSSTEFSWCHLDHTKDYCLIQKTICDPKLNYWWKCSVDCVNNIDAFPCGKDAENRFKAYKNC